jgi:hypothetical protein
VTADRDVRDTGDVRDNDAFDGGVRLGLAAYGIVHLMVAYTALRLALGDQDTQASSQGALSALAQSGLGQVSLLVLAAGFVVLSGWQGIEAVKGHTDDSGARRAVMRLASGVKVVVYLALAGTAVQKAFGEGSGGRTDSLTAQVMSATGGRYLVGVLGLTIIGIGVHLCYYGLVEEFVERLDLEAKLNDRRPLIVSLGKVGHVAKGIAFGVVGALFVAAAWQFEPKESGGLDQGLRALLQQPFGPYLVGAVALGLISYGLYCFAWARHHVA